MPNNSSVLLSRIVTSFFSPITSKTSFLILLALFISISIKSILPIISIKSSREYRASFVSFFIITTFLSEPIPLLYS